MPTKFQCLAIHTDPNSIHRDIPRPFHITEPTLRAQVTEKEAIAVAAAEAAKLAPANMKGLAEQEAATAKTAAIEAREAVPEEYRAYGIETCGAAI